MAGVDTQVLELILRDGVTPKMVNMVLSLDKTIRKVQQMQNTVKGTETRLNGLGSSIDSTTKKFAKLGTGVGTNATQLGSLFKNIAKIRSEVGLLSYGFKSILALTGASKLLGWGEGLAKSILDTTNAMEQYRARLTTVLGTQEKVNATLAFLSDFAKTTPYNLSEVTDAFVRLSAYGLQPTAEKFRTIGDFAASMSRTFSDAVEAIADATHGEFERLREFGITKQMVQGQDKNLINAKNQITDYAKFQTTLFKMMEMRSAGSMERLMNTPAGKLSNLSDSIQRIMMKLGDRIKGPFMNALEVITRVIERLDKSGVIDRLGDKLAKLFTVERMKAFAKTITAIVLRVKDAFTGNLVDAFTIVTHTVAKFFDYFTYRLEDIGNRLGRLARLMGEAFQLKGNNPLDTLMKRMEGMGKAFGSLSKPGKTISEQWDMLFKLLGHNAAIGGAVNRIEDRKNNRRDSLSFIDDLFKGLSDNPALMKEGAGANFGGFPTATQKTPLDKITEMIFGNGQLARLGIKSSELQGMGFKEMKSLKPKKRALEINFRTGNKKLDDHYKEVTEEVISQAVEQGFLAVPA